MKTYGYLRVSTQDQGSDGVSLDMQLKRIEAYCTANNLPKPEIYKDVASGSINDRAGLAAILNQMECGDILIIYSLSRLSRSTKTTIELGEVLEQRGVDLVSLSEKIDTTSAAGKMFFRIMAVLAEFERDVISERTKSALGNLKKQGKRTGQIPYSKRILEKGSKDLADNPHELEAMRLAVKLRNTGLSYRKIGERLSAQGYAPRGKCWHAQSVKNLIAKAA